MSTSHERAERSVDLVLGLHCHQPVGNFPEVMESAYRDAYLPFIEHLERFERIKAVLHYTGPLWGFFRDEHPTFIARLRTLAAAGRVELLGGGFYEPILAVISEHDARLQLNRMRCFLREELRQDPLGAWLAERVWEPHLPALLHACGVQYVPIDDGHFHRVGYTSDELDGHYTTEHLGQSVGLFPISAELRYLIPFREVDEVIGYVRGQAEQRRRPLLSLVDDGEKLGVWPGTKRWVYEEGWLERFFRALTREARWLRTVTLREAFEERPSLGRVYLPTTSYFELGEWALPLAGIRRLEELKQLLGDQFRPFASQLAGGHWRGFLAKYPEADYVHKRVLEVSRRVRRMPMRSPDRARALDHILQAQSNDAYWHGLFGGVYLPHLRDAVWHHLLQAERLARGRAAHVQLADVDTDGRPEAVLRSPYWSLVVTPHEGGTLRELSSLELPFNFLNTIARRREAYHDQVAATDTERGEGARSIHDIRVAKQANLERYLVWDRGKRLGMVDRLLRDDATVERLAAQEPCELVELASAPYELERSGSGVTMKCDAVLPGNVHLTICKSLRLAEGGRTPCVELEVINTGSVRAKVRYASEFNLALLAGDAPDRRIEVPGRTLPDAHNAGTGCETDVRLVRFVNGWDRWTLEFEVSGDAQLWRYPVHTVNNSEAGFELVYQSTCVLFVWQYDLPPQQSWKALLNLRVQQTESA